MKMFVQRQQIFSWGWMKDDVTVRARNFFPFDS